MFVRVLIFLAFLGLIVPTKPVFGAETAVLAETIPVEYQKFALSYFGMYQGPSLSKPLGRGSIDSSTLTNEEGEQNLQSQFKFDYYFAPHAYVGAVLNFQINPIAVAGNPAIQMLDSGVRIGHNRILHTDNFNLLADFRVTGPMKPENRRRDEIVDFQSLQVMTYQIPKTKLTLGVVGFHTLQIYGSNLPLLGSNDLGAAKDWNLYFGPYVSYQLSNSLSALVSVDIKPYHRVGAPWDTWASDPMDIAPGISWDFAENLNLQAQVLVYPSQLRWDTLGSMIYLYAQII